ncbi:MAG: hypothetical protein Q4G59_06515, partial [Planctomycetia bacterium]|nr:hypothetical protein [Planctomycetia bacterium]
RLTEKVITAAVVKAYESSPSKRWILPQGAFLTPSAKDELRGRNIELVRATGADSVCSSQQTIATGTNSVQVFAPKTNNVVQVSGSPFVLALHATEKEQLLPTYVSWAEETLHPRQIRKNCIIETTNELRAIFAAEDKAKGLIVTPYPALAVVLANRNREFRCCVAKDMRQLQADAFLLGANLLVVNPKETSVFLLRQMTKWFVGAGVLMEPDYLTRALR